MEGCFALSVTLQPRVSLERRNRAGVSLHEAQSYRCYGRAVFFMLGGVRSLKATSIRETSAVGNMQAVVSKRRKFHTP